MQRLTNNLIYLFLAVFGWICLFYLRIRRIVFSFVGLSFEIGNFADFFYVCSGLVQDFLFVLLLFCIVSLLDKLLHSDKVASLVLQVISCVTLLVIMLYSLADYGYFQTAGDGITFAKIKIVKTNILDLSDSFFSYVSGFDIFVLLLCVIAMIATVVLLNIVECPEKLADFAEHFRINVGLLASLIVIYIFFSCYCELYASSCSNALAIQPIVHLLTHFELTHSDKIETTETPTDKTFEPFNSDSKTQPISIMDRQIMESVRAKAKIPKNYNIVLYLSESTFAGYYPFYNGGSENVGVSPFIESKLTNSLLLKRMYTTSVRSINSLINLLTGLAGYPGYKQINGLAEYTDTPSLSQLLVDKGYKSALVHGGNFYFYEKMKFLANRDFDFLIDAAQLKKKYPTAMSNSWGIDDRLLVTEGLSWIDKTVADGKNFTLTLVPIAPHHPYEVPSDIKKYIDKPKNDYQAYLNALKYVDEVFKQLYEGLESRGLIDDTIIVFTADHGEAFGQHKGNFGHENHIFEENVRIPCMFFNPKLFVGYNELQTVVNLSDILPSLLDILKVDVPIGCQGESIFSRSTGKYSFFACGERNVDIGMIDGNYKAVYDYINNEMHLYNLDNELYDFHDIADKEQRLAMDYKKVLTQYYQYQKNYLENFNRIMSQVRLQTNTKTEVSLLDLEPFFVAQNKYEVKKNCDYQDKPIKILDKTYKVGYGVYANSCMKFDIKGLGFKSFKGICGKLDVPSWRQNFLEMRIYVDGVMAFNSGKITTDDPPLTFNVDVTDGEVLELIVLDGGDNDRDDNAAWINPILIK